MLHTRILEKSLKTSKFVTNASLLLKLKKLKFNISQDLCLQSNNFEKEKQIEDLFLNPTVQRILKKITCVYYERVFAVSKKPLAPPKYEFVTDKMLKELQDVASAKAALKLQMPPVMSVRKPSESVLSRDPELQGYLKSKVVFTDISPNVSSRNRVITVRETDGTLRTASWEERDRMNQIFYPAPGRSLEIPKMFENPYLDKLLDEGSYKFVLDSACCQFEPDDPIYYRVTSATYDHIKNKKRFDDLRSTRHFGPMAFYYALTRSIDPLLIDMIERQLINDASDTIKLLYLMHEEMRTSENIDENNDIAVIEDYIENNASQKSDLESALQTFLEQTKSTDKASA